MPRPHGGNATYYGIKPFMYDTALPADTVEELTEIGTAEIVVGIPSYRNGRTIQHVTATVVHALATHYPHLQSVVLNTDGLAYDETVQLAQDIELPDSVRQVATRYLGLPGKGSALRAIFEAATLLQARAVVIIEADTESITPDWIPALVAPLLERTADVVTPHYSGVAPRALTNDLIAYPLIQGLYRANMRYPLGGEIAMTGGVAAFFAERDVWETDVARDGVDGWMALQIVAGGGRLQQVALPTKYHRDYDTLTGLELKFAQEAGILLRTGLLNERAWHDGEHPPLHLLPYDAPSDTTLTGLPDAAVYWHEGSRAVRHGVEAQWEAVLHPRTLQVVRHLREHSDYRLLDARLWAHIVYDFLVVYNIGENDPDKVLNALYPLYLLRAGTMVALQTPETSWEALVQEQARAFVEAFDYFVRRWDTYIPPHT